jgi:poly(A) polymerase
MKLRVEPEVLSYLNEISRFLNERRIQSYLVGGFIRDTLLGRSTADIDIAIDADALKTAREMADALGGKYVLLDEENLIARVVLSPSSNSSGNSQWYIDLSTLTGDIFQDLDRRDFTINAMAVEIKEPVLGLDSTEILDPLNGQSDLKQKIIKAVSEAVFEADPARLLRAVRLAAELGFTVSRDTEVLIRRDSRLITRIAGERVRDELLRILAVPTAGKYVRFLDDFGLLTAIIPELEASRGVEQPKEHHWDVLNHSLESVKAVDFLLRQSGSRGWEHVPNHVLDEIPWSGKLDRYFASEVGAGSTRASLLKLAALLHDIAKPETKIIANERVRFFGHTDQGAETVVGILERLRFSNKEVRLIETMVRHHMRPTQMSQQGLPSARAIYRFFRDTGEAGIDILFLSLADHLAARGPDLDLSEWKWHAGQVNCVLTECTRRESIVSPPKLIDGNDLIHTFGLKPGPKIKEILESVREAQAAGELVDREQALSYVKNRLL